MCQSRTTRRAGIESVEAWDRQKSSTAEAQCRGGSPGHFTGSIRTGRPCAPAFFLPRDQDLAHIVAGQEKLERRKIAKKIFDVAVVEHALQPVGRNARRLL